MAQPNLAWGGFGNGQIPRANLVDIGGGKLLQADAAYRWKNFSNAFRSEWGDPLYLADYQDAYRDYARQKEMYDRWKATGLPKNGVASPGNSIHGWARSVDCSGYGASGSARHLWMQRNAATYGWSWAYGSSLNESWHWDYVGPITTTAGDGGLTPIEEIPMSMFDDFVLNPSGGGFWFSPNYGALPVTALEAQAIAAVKAFQTSGTRVPDNMLSTASNMVRRAATGWIIPQIAAAVPAATGSFTTADRAMLDSIATSGELGQALTSTVVLVNQQAEANKDEILEAIGEIPAGSSAAGAYSLELSIDGVPGTASGTATPSV